MTVVGHLGGVPLEEWLPPLAFTAGGTVLGLRAVLRRVRSGLAAGRAAGSGLGRRPPRNLVDADAHRVDRASR